MPTGQDAHPTITTRTQPSRSLALVGASDCDPNTRMLTIGAGGSMAEAGAATLALVDSGVVRTTTTRHTLADSIREMILGLESRPDTPVVVGESQGGHAVTRVEASLSGAPPCLVPCMRISPWPIDPGRFRSASRQILAPRTPSRSPLRLTAPRPWGGSRHAMTCRVGLATLERVSRDQSPRSRGPSIHGHRCRAGGTGGSR